MNLPWQQQHPMGKPPARDAHSSGQGAITANWAANSCEQSVVSSNDTGSLSAVCTEIVKQEQDGSCASLDIEDCNMCLGSGQAPDLKSRTGKHPEP